MYAFITSEFEAMSESMLAERFCIKHGIGTREARLTALFIEETALNILEHGKAKALKHLSTGKYALRFEISVSAFYEAHKDDPPENMSGLKIVMKLADDVRYFNAFNSNNIMVYIDTEKGDKIHEGSKH